MKNGLMIFLLLAACSSAKNKPDNVYRSNDGRPLVDDKYSLQADRQALDEMRNQIPEETKRQNDELAYILGMMSETKRPPAELRSQFDGALRKKRELFDRDLQRERERFTRDERKNREAFLKTQQQAREQFGREKHERDEKNDFYKALDEKRTEYFSVEREKRNDFESDVRERRQSFDDYVRQKQNEFNQEHRAYTKRFEDMKRKPTGPTSVSAAVSDDSEARTLERELQEIQNREGTPLRSGE